ncbi:arabinosyltransferase domain-containing protein, partial [Saccharomonospora saliphila]|uniref:arabinosyltransferase domain-containing protein n=1 Tax=Saccharomonospora saliphila TaxID=369829 RepID=UPI00048D36FC
MTFRHWMITGTGLATALAALLFVFAPVETETTSYTWPEGPGARSAALPLMPGEPERVTVEFGCADVRALAGPGVLLSTTLPGEDGPEGSAARDSAGTAEHGDGLVVSVAGTEGDRVSVTSAGRELVDSHPVGASCAWTVISGGGTTTVSVDGARIGHAPGTPIVTGLSTDLDGPTGLRATVVPDTRYESTPGPLKVALGVLVLAGLGTVFALVRRWDRARTPTVRLLPARWWRPRWPDGVVALTLLAWMLVGSPTVDDGYIVTMLKAAEETGFVGNYFRWFNAPESPFSWFYELYRPLAEVSGAVWWLRLPSVLLGVVLWLCLDRLLVRRLVTGPARGARWCAAAAFLLFYVQFGVGLRPEPWVMLGTLVVFVLVERAVATRALTPLAAAITAAAVTVAITPTGLVALAPFVAALVPLTRLVWRYWPVVVPVSLACGASAALLMVADQSLAAVLHSIDVRTTIGPNHGVLDESLRYEALFEPLRGGLNRRMPMLLLWLSMAVLLVLLLARRTPGLAPGPTRRALVVTALFFGALAFTPTKYFHHFGAIGALA